MDTHMHTHMDTHMDTHTHTLSCTLTSTQIPSHSGSSFLLCHHPCHMSSGTEEGAIASVEPPAKRARLNLKTNNATTHVEVHTRHGFSEWKRELEMVLQNGDELEVATLGPLCFRNLRLLAMAIAIAIVIAR